MPARTEHKQPDLPRSGLRPANSFAAVGAARAAHKQSLERFSRLCQLAVNFRGQAALRAHRNEWISYAAELRCIEGSLQFDLRYVNLLVHRILSPTSWTESVGAPPHNLEKTGRVDAVIERLGIVVKQADSTPLPDDTSDEKRDSCPRALPGSRDPAKSCAVETKVPSGARTPSITTGAAPVHSAFPHGEEYAEKEDTLAQAKILSTKIIRSLDQGGPGTLRKPSAPYLSLGPEAETFTSSVAIQQWEDYSAQLENILLLKWCTKVLANSFPSCVKAERNKSTDVAHQRKDGLQTSEQTMVSKLAWAWPTEERLRPQKCGSQQRCHSMPAQDKSSLPMRTHIEQLYPLAEHAAPDGGSTHISTQIANFAVLLRMQHEVLDHTCRKLQLEEASAEKEVLRARADLRYLLRARAFSPTSLVRRRRSRITAAQSLHRADACAAGSASLSRLSTQSELDLQLRSPAGAEREPHSSGDLTDEEDELDLQLHSPAGAEREPHSSGDLTDEEDELLQDLTEAGCTQTSMSSSEEESRGAPGYCNPIVRLRDTYVRQLENMEAELKRQLDSYNQQADHLHTQQQSLLQKARDGGGPEGLREHSEACGDVYDGGALRPSQGRRDFDPRTRASTKERRIGHSINESASAFGALMQNINSTLFPEEKDCKETLVPASQIKRYSPSLHVAPTCHQGNLQPLWPTTVGNAAPISSDCVDSTTFFGDLAGNSTSKSSCETAFCRSLREHETRARTLLRYATRALRGSQIRRQRESSYTNVDKLKFTFPEASPETLRKLLHVEEQLLLLQQRRAATLWCFSRRREEAHTATREQLKQLVLRLEEEGRRKEQDVQQRKRTAILQQRLEEQRRQAEEKQRALRDVAEVRAAAQRAREVCRLEKEKQRRMEDKRLIAEYREAKAEACKRREIEAAAALEREALERVARARRLRHLVLRRREEDLWKSRIQAQARQHEALRQAQVVERLLKLAATYAVHVPADPQRVKQPTCASQARTQQIRAERQQAQEVHGQGHRLLQGRSIMCFEVPYGYNVDKLLSDMRLRLSTALHEAGLSGTKAGREALLAVDVHAMRLPESVA